MEKLKMSIIIVLTCLLPVSLFSQTLTKNSFGSHDGYYYSFWNDKTSGTVSFTLMPHGQYKTKWENIGNFTSGKGWAVGKEDRVINYKGEFNGGTNGFLAVYGWTKDSLVEYYVVENYGEWVPPGSVSLGSFESDGGVYNIYKTLRVEQPSIVGTATFYQFWSVRNSKRNSGTVTFKNHVEEWRKRGMVLGKVWDYQIMETEGVNSTGYSDITVEEGNKKRD